MSSIRKAAPRRTHRERSQPQARTKLGLLEKHKDYVLRAKDFHRKEKSLRTMKQKAAMRNPDEFYFGMIHSKTRNGVHIVERRNEKLDQDTLALLKTQDQNYVNYHRSINLKKLERMKQDDHIRDDISGRKHVVYVDSTKQVRDFEPTKHSEPEVGNEEVQKERRALKAELKSRMDREENLRKVQIELQLQKDLMGKGPRKKVGVDSRGLNVYKWKPRRKK